MWVEVICPNYLGSPLPRFFCTESLVCGQGDRSFLGSPNQPLTGNARLRFLGKPKEMGTATKRQNLDSTHDEHMVAQTLCCNHLAFATGCSVGLRGLSAQIVDRTSRTHASRAISDLELVNSYLDNGYILRMRDLEWITHNAAPRSDRLGLPGGRGCSRPQPPPHSAAR